jgi:hypothetical protein
MIRSNRQLSITSVVASQVFHVPIAELPIVSWVSHHAFFAEYESAPLCGSTRCFDLYLRYTIRTSIWGWSPALPISPHQRIPVGVELPTA